MSETPRFQDLAKGVRAGFWTTAAGFVLVLVVWLAAGFAILMASPEARALVSMEDGHPPTPSGEAIGALALLLGGFLPGFATLLFWRRFVERRPMASLFTGHGRFRWSLAAAAALATTLLAMTLGALLDVESFAPFADRLARFTPADWAMILAAYGVAFAVQATFEEVFVRGWLLQHLARKLARAGVVIVATALIFSAMHWGHPGWATHVATFALGLAYGWSAFRLNGLEAAIGGHVANNFLSGALFGALMAGNEAVMTGPQMGMYALYALGFVGFVEAWARFGPRPAPAPAPELAPPPPPPR
jgi:membrane protease YdiL (CAAX protease family)